MQFNVAVTWFFNRLNAQKRGGEAEYPPSPARLLQAALAGAYQMGDSAAIENVRKAIQFLERQKAPDIYAVEPVFGTKFEHFVHNNAVPEFDSEEQNTHKRLNPTLLNGSDSQVVYAWNLPQESSGINLSALRTAFDGLLALGHGDDMAFARIVGTIPSPPRHYVPTRGGSDAVLNVPRPGFLDDLDVAYRNQDRNEVMAEHLQPYTLEEHLPQLRRIANFELQQIENDQLFAVDVTRASIVAAWVRHAAIEALKKDLPADQLSIIAGHAKTNKIRVFYMPLPSTGEYADFMIRRVCIFAPPELSDAIRLMRNVLPGRILTGNEGKEICRLGEARSNTVFEHYTNAGTEFETVTPAVFPHHLTKNGRLDSRRLREAGKWFLEAGVPELAELSVQFQREKFFAPTYMQKLPQYRLRARFDRPVFGPIAVGLGRFSGLGIFANRSGLQAKGEFAKNAWQQEGRTVEEIGAY